MSPQDRTRRELLAFGRAAFGQRHDVAVETARLPPLGELVNVLEFEDAARLTLDRSTYGLCAGSHRAGFDRMTLWPRVFVDSAPLNLSVGLFGQQMFAPIIVGPVANQRQYHLDGERATVQGAAEAKATVVVSSRSSVPIEEIASHSKTTTWYQAEVSRGISEVRSDMIRAVKAGCRAVCLTVGPTAPSRTSGVASDRRPNWRAIEQLSQAVDVPVLLKGVMSAPEALRAIEKGVEGLVISNGGVPAAGPAPIEILKPIVDAVGPHVPVLVDGSFRRGTDIIKALAFGARAVLIARPVIWGLAAYGADGVQAVLQLLQRDLARTMVNVGMPTIARIDRTLVRVHARASS